MIRKQFITWIIAAIIIGGLLSYVSAQHSDSTQAVTLLS